MGIIRDRAYELKSAIDSGYCGNRWQSADHFGWSIMQLDASIRHTKDHAEEVGFQIGVLAPNAPLAVFSADESTVMNQHAKRASQGEAMKRTRWNVRLAYQQSALDLQGMASDDPQYAMARLEFKMLDMMHELFTDAVSIMQGS